MGAVTSGTSVLIVEDDWKILRVFATSLEVAGYDVIEAGSGHRAIEEVRTRNPDIILLDLGLPDIDGLALVPTIREHTATPIIVVSAREQDADKVKALDSGANDYLTKPFSFPELLARIRVALRSHAQVGITPRTIIAFGDYHLDLAGRRLMHEDRQVSLSATEFKLLATFARHPDEVVTTNVLLKETWGAAHQDKKGYVRVYMHSLRQKLEADPARPRYLVNEAGLGYRLNTRFEGELPIGGTHIHSQRHLAPVGLLQFIRYFQFVSCKLRQRKSLLLPLAVPGFNVHLTQRWRILIAASNEAGNRRIHHDHQSKDTARCCRHYWGLQHCNCSAWRGGHLCRSSRQRARNGASRISRKHRQCHTAQ
jgi:two-component system KDP operon response regulator KdpE